MADFNTLFLSPQWLKEYHTKYPHGLSVMENLIEWVNQVNELIGYVNLSPDKVLEVLEGWKQNGELDDIIDSFFSNLKTRLDNTGMITVKDFGAVGDGITDDTVAFKLGIAACKMGGVRSGTALYIPTGNYLITEKIIVDAPVAIWGLSAGSASDLNDAPKLIFQNCSGFVFIESAGYCDFKNIRLQGNKSSVVIATRNFGNTALDFGYGGTGKFESMRVEGFDIGILTQKRAGQSWSGGYRYFNYVKARGNTYNIVQLDYTTDNNFLQCDFRDSIENKKGYIYIEAESTGYQTTNFIDCMFELLGENSTPRNFNAYGMQIKGKSLVRIIGGYIEACAIFVDKKATLISSAYHKYGSAATVIGGGGLINLDGITGNNKYIDFPKLSDTSFWTTYNNTFDGQDLDGNIRANKFTVTGSNPSITTSDFTKFQELSFDAFPMDMQNGIVKVEVEFKAPAGRHLRVVPAAGVSQETWNDDYYYTRDGSWRRMTFTFPIYLDRNEMLEHTLRPAIFLDNGEAGDVFLIRSLSYQILSE